MDSNKAVDINSLFPEPRKLNQHVRYVERSSAELDTSLNVIRSASAFESKYKLGAQIGKGGFGKVHEATDISTGRSVVIKQIDSDRVPCWCRFDGVMVPMEVILLRKLTKIEGVSEMIEVYDLNGTWNIVMNGNRPKVLDLFDHICKRGYLNEGESAFIMYQLIGILLQCHNAGVIHRDLKDENLLIDQESCQIRLIDFGSGSFLHDGLYSDFDGTRVYSPPEWIKYGEYIGKSAEVWTIGILLFDMLNGDIPFNTDSEITSGTVRFRRSGVSEEAKNLILSCVRQFPDERPNLTQILSHPWMRMYRNVVAEMDCQASRYALEVADQCTRPHLPLSSTVRSGLCKLERLHITKNGRSHLKKASLTHGDCEISPDLLPIQSAESVSESLRRQLGSTIPSSSSEHSPRPQLRPTFTLNPIDHDHLHRFDARFPNADESNFFRRQQEQEQQRQFSLGIARDFQLSEDSPSHTSSGYISRSSSIEEQDRRAVGTNTASNPANVATNQQSNSNLSRVESIDSSYSSSSNHPSAPTPIGNHKGDMVNLSQISGLPYFKQDIRRSLMISCSPATNDSILKSGRISNGGGFDILRVQSCLSHVPHS